MGGAMRATGRVISTGRRAFNAASGEVPTLTLSVGSLSARANATAQPALLIPSRQPALKMPDGRSSMLRAINSHSVPMWIALNFTSSNTVIGIFSRRLRTSQSLKLTRPTQLLRP